MSYKTTAATNPENGGSGIECDRHKSASYKDGLESLLASIEDEYIHEPGGAKIMHWYKADQELARARADIESAKSNPSEPDLELTMGCMIYRLRKDKEEDAAPRKKGWFW